VADETTSPDLRWLVERNHAETTSAIADLRAQVAAIPAAMDRYVLAQVYEADEKRRGAEREADRLRFERLETNDNTQAAGGRAWVLGIGLAAVGAVFGWIAQVMTARGGH
jgi:hypothetical protein